MLNKLANKGTLSGLLATLACVAQQFPALIPSPWLALVGALAGLITTHDSIKK